MTTIQPSLRWVPQDGGSAAPVADTPVLCGREGAVLLVDHPVYGVIRAHTTVRFTSVSLARALAQRAPVALLDGPVPVVVGLLEPLPESANAEGSDEPELVLSSRGGVQLRCGDASIRLTPAGQVIVSGTDLMSRARRLQQIVGAIVRIN